MRVALDLPAEQPPALAKLGQARGRSRTALVRETVAEYLGKHEAGGLDEAFGLWRTEAGQLEEASPTKRGCGPSGNENR